MEISRGISNEHREKIAAGLSGLLADSVTPYLKTHNFHRNVEGPLLNTLHLMFKAQYPEPALAVDRIAERTRALGIKASGSYSEFGEPTPIDEPKADVLPQRMEIHE